MTDTPQAIKDLQLQIWLAKPPIERLHQLMTDNEAMIDFWKQAKLSIANEKNIQLNKNQTIK